MLLLLPFVPVVIGSLGSSQGRGHDAQLRTQEEVPRPSGALIEGRRAKLVGTRDAKSRVGSGWWHNPQYDQRVKAINDNNALADSMDATEQQVSAQNSAKERATESDVNRKSDSEENKANQKYTMSTDELNSDQAEGRTLQEQQTSLLGQVEGPVGPTIQAGAAEDAQIQKSVEKVESQFTKEATSANNRADATLTKEESDVENDMADAEKGVAAGEKSNEQVLATEERDAEKGLAGMEKTREKQEGFLQAKAEQQDERIIEQTEAANMMTSTAANRIDQTDSMLTKLQQKDEKRATMQERAEDGLISNLEMVQEELESQGATTGQAVTQILQDNMKETAKSGEEEAEATSQVIQEQAKNTEKFVADAEEQFKEGDSELIEAENNQRAAARKVERGISKGENAVEKNKEGFKDEEGDLKDGVAQGIRNLNDQVTQKTDTVAAGLESNIEKKEQGAVNQVKSEAEGISNEADGIMDQSSQSFESGIAGSGNKLQRTEREFAKTRAAVDEDLRTTKQNIDTLDKLDKSVGVVLTQFGQQNVASQQRTVAASKAFVEDRVSQTADSLAKTQEAINSRQTKDKSQMLAIDEEVTKDITRKTDELGKALHASEKEAKDAQTKVTDTMRQLSADGTMSEQTLAALQKDLSDITQDVGKFKGKGIDRIMGVTETLSQAQQELKGLEETSTEQSQQYGTEKANAAQEAITKMLGENRGAFDQESTQVRMVLGAASKAAGARRESEQALEKGAALELGKQVSRLSKQEEEFGMGENAKTGTRFSEIMAKLREAHAQLHEIEELSAKDRTAFENTAKQELVATIAKYQEEMLKELEKGMQTSAAGLEQMGVNLDGFRKQADMEQEGEKVIMDRSIQAMAQAKTEIMDKVMRLQESEHDTTGGTWAEEAKEALALMRQDSAAQTAAFSKIQGRSVEQESSMVKEVEQERESLQAQRAQQLSMLLGNIDSLKTVDRETKDKIMQMLQNTDREVGRKTDGIQSNEMRIQEQLALSLDKIQQELKQQEDGVQAGERAVKDNERENMKKVDDLSLQQQKERTAEQSRQSAVNRAMKTEEQAVGTEVSQMKNGVDRMMNKLDPTNELNIITQSVKSIGELMGKAEQEEQLKVNEVDNDVKVINNKIEKLLQEANIEGGQLSKGVMEAALRSRDRLSSLKTRIMGENQDLRSVASDMASTTKDLMSAQNRRIGVLQKKMDGTRKQLQEVVGLQKYQSGDALDKVQFVLDKAVDVDQGMIDYKDNTLLPPTKTWRGQVENVFEGMNMAMDMERVERMAAASMAAEEAEGGGMMSAKEKMDHEIAMIKKRMQNEIDWVREKAKNKVAEIEANESLSRRQKDALIAAIMKKADREVYALTIKTQKMLSDQYMSAHKLDEEIHSLQALVERAENLAGQGTAESAAWAKAMKEEIKERIKSLRKRYIDNYSLLQIDALQERLEGKKRSALGAVSHGAEAGAEARARAADQAEADLAAMAAARKRSDRELDQQLEALKLLGAKLPQLQPQPH